MLRSCTTMLILQRATSMRTALAQVLGVHLELTAVTSLESQLFFSIGHHLMGRYAAVGKYSY